MARPKMRRNSTNIDMTAMCDVAFLLLSFFILTTKFKAPEAIPVITPSSVSAKVAPETDVTLITISKDGKAFISLDNPEVKQKMAEDMNKEKNLGLTAADIEAFKTVSFFGSSFSQLPSYLKVPADQLKATDVPGIPIDTAAAKNELIDWMKYVVAAHSATGAKFNLILKGDNLAKYPQFRSVVVAFKKNAQFKFQMVTNPEGVPEGTDLWKRYQTSGGAPTPEAGG
ncbi:biopolymer transporter ExbD [Segetibacter sp. 3557_3]|uniref:ExbD/TolR family protein n=1 Tax=Segetibacter sp. 3557_3 TaxID=2547429 RepID=UPI001058EFB5|nr:biopolymer transporter ExbD [Segetibacter sp. 3557_3]TDH21316.1 biopolymer transporter ExbD [Segetibacter sp. 3557_3]